MKVATWNVNGMKARLDFMRLWLADRSPDVVGLQELKLTDDTFPHDVFAELGYQAVTHGQKSWNGVAILSREPVEVTQVGLPGQDELGARLIELMRDGVLNGFGQFGTVHHFADEVAIALFAGDAPRRGVRLTQVAHFCQRCHLVANGR